MATSTEIKNNNNTLIREKTAPSSITKDNVADQLDAIVDYVDQEKRPYKVYSALITHGAGDGNPTAQVLENNIGAVTWGYEEPNNYGVSSSGLFTLNKTMVFVSSSTNPLMKVGAMSTNANFVSLTTENDGFANLAIEIRVYP